MDERQEEKHNEKQIHDAFVDGYLSCAGNEMHRDAAEQAWRDENTTERVRDTSGASR